jgi:hypothetical protein
LLLTALDLTNATVVSSETMPARVLIEEVEKRTRVRWKTGESGSPAIVIRNSGSGPAEGFSIAASGSTIAVSGNDARGTLFGVGYLLRQLRWSRDAVSAPDNLAIVTAPKVALRGHQLGYRPKPNSYDGWTAAMLDQYIRELALFGTNAIELIPPRSDDDPDSPHFPVAQMPMMIEMSRIVASYGLDCWVWYPALDEDYSKPEQVEFALKEWAEVIRQLPRVDAVFVPGGDPGHTPPKVLMPFLEKQAASIRKLHPKAQMWVAPQGFTKAWMDDFFEILRAEPKWLTGVVYGPQSRMTIHELRAATPKKYPLRHYPDITHTLNSQFPVPDWDFALARTHHREPIDPRPVDQAIVFRHTNPATIGFLTYSEGCNDDVNKFVWSALGWNPDADLADALRDYGRVFFGPDVADEIAQLIFALERNWRGPLRENGGVAVTLAQAQALERAASPQLRLNWRFQQLLYRAYYDAYVRARWFHESSAEDWSHDKLRRASETGTLAAMSAAESILDNAANEPVAIDLRQRVYALAEALYQSVRMQLSVAKYQGEPGRGNTLDSVEAPLNNRAWLNANFARIRAMEKESDRLEELRRVVEWENPGPGGFYDDLGNPSRQPRLVPAMAYADDPSGLKSPVVAFGSNRFDAPWRTSSLTDAQAYYDAPLSMQYAGLDPSARYRLEVLDGSIASDTFEMRLLANDTIEVHGWRKKQPGQRLSFVLPQAATASGQLKLTWHPTPGRGGAGRGLQIAEVWLIREEER